MTSATIANLRVLVQNGSFGQPGTQESILSHIDNVENTIRQASAFRDQGKADQAAHFEAKGYDSLKQLSEKVKNYSDEHVNPALNSELLIFIQYMIDHKTIKASNV